MVLILIAIHAIFFGIGYLSTDTIFKSEYYYYSAGSDLGILYFVSVLIGILLLVGWLVFYSRNNGFKSFYPRSTSQLYLEWLLIFIITIGITVIPFTLTQGYTTKWRAVASLNDIEKAIEILDKAEVLIPSDNDDYRYNSSYDKPISIPQDMKLSADTLDLKLYDTEYSYSDGILIKGYIGPSLLFGIDNYNYQYYRYQNKAYIDKETLRKIEHNEQVKKWLREGKTDSLLYVMKEFEKLQKMHGFKVNITPEKWLKRIYNPPFFPVNSKTAISKYNRSDYEDQYNDTYESNEVVVIEEAPPVYDDFDNIPYSSLPYLPYNELKNGYEHLYEHYEYDNDLEIILLICMCFALGLSVFVFSFRITSGKQWLIAFVSTGILIFIVILSGVAMQESIGYRSSTVVALTMLLFWVFLFIILVGRVISKIVDKSNKGRSGIYMNTLIWLIPCLVPLLFTAIVAHSEMVDKRYFNPDEHDVMCMIWLNILFTAVAMWFVSVLVRKWKSIADE